MTEQAPSNKKVGGLQFGLNDKNEEPKIKDLPILNTVLGV